MSDEFAASTQDKPIDLENHDEKSKTWWIFHHLKGFNITDESHDLDNPMFGDATIVSKNMFKK